MLKNKRPSPDIDEQDKNTKAVEKALGEPFMLEFSETVRKMRTHLLIGGVVSLAAVLMDLTIAPNTPVFGVVFDGLTEGKILALLLAINVYLFIHFFWSSIDSFQEWRLRRTGTMVSYLTTIDLAFGNDELDFPPDPRQSTLYSWWRDRSKRLISLPQATDQIDSKITPMMDAVISELNKGQTPDLVSWQREFMSIREQLKAIKDSLEDSDTLVAHDRISVSLERFDSAFKVLLKSQNIRWITLEWLVPLLLGVSAIGALIYKLAT